MKYATMIISGNARVPTLAVDNQKERTTKMKAYKCDICGELYEKFNTLKLPKIQAAIKRLDSIFTQGKTCDICPDCISAIQKVIDGRSKENE